MLLLGEIGGLFGAILSARLAQLFRHPLTLCAAASLGIAMVVLAIPFGTALPIFQLYRSGVAAKFFAGER